MNTRALRTAFVLTGIVMLTYFGSMAERLLFWEYIALQCIAVFFLIFGAHLWTKLKGRHWAWSLTMIVWPIGVLVLSILKESGTDDDNHASQPQVAPADTTQRSLGEKLQGAGSFVRDCQELALRAEQLNIRGDHRAVVELLEPHAEVAENDNTSYFNELGIAYGKIGSQPEDSAYWHKAYACHRKAHDLDRNEPIYMFNLAMAATWIERYKEAQELLTKYLESGHRKEHELAKDLLMKLKAMQ